MDRLRHEVKEVGNLPSRELFMNKLESSYTAFHIVSETLDNSKYWRPMEWSLITMWRCQGLTFWFSQPQNLSLRAPARTWLLLALTAYFLTTAFGHFSMDSCVTPHPYSPTRAYVLALLFFEVPPTSSSLDLDLLGGSHQPQFLTTALPLPSTQILSREPSEPFA